MNRDSLGRERTQVLDTSDTARLEYRAFRPSAPLATWVEAISVVRVPRAAPTRLWRRVPDGRPRLGIALDPPRRDFVLDPPRFGPSVITAPSAGHWAVVRFAPWSTGPLGLWDASPPPDWLAPLTAKTGTEWVVGPPAEAAAGVGFALESALLPPGPDARAVHAWLAFAEDPGTSVESVARAAGVSPRTLLRAVRHASGCTPREARSLERLKVALLRLREDLSLSWTRAALEAGFFDQAHFVRVFHDLIGLAPTPFFEEGHHHMNDVFALRVEPPAPSPGPVAIGGPFLRSPEDRRPLARDQRRSTLPEPRGGST